MKLTPYEMVQEISKLPPYLREKAEDNYIGTAIKWRLLFRSVRDLEDGLARVSMTDPESYPWIYTNVDLSNYSELKFSHEKMPLLVSGTIKSFRGHTIEVENSEVNFIEEAEDGVTHPRVVGGNFNTKNVAQHEQSHSGPKNVFPSTWYGQIVIGLLILLIGGFLLFLLGWN